MSNASIRAAIIGLEEYFQSDRYQGPLPDTAATATIEKGLRCRVESPDGRGIHTDMSPAFGGEGSAHSPGWLARAALASCDATAVALRAARLGIELESIEVSVEASSDGRGIMLDKGISPASSDMSVVFRIGAAGVPREQVQALVDWVVAHSPVGADLEHPVGVQVELEIL